MISTVMEGHMVYRILVDHDNLVNILLAEAMTKIGIHASKMALVLTPFIGIEKSVMSVKGAIELTVTVGIAPYCVTIQHTFMVIITHLLCNAIIRRPLLHHISAMVSTKYLTMKFPTVKGVAAMKGNQEALRKYANTFLKGKKALLVDQLQGSNLPHA